MADSRASRILERASVVTMSGAMAWALFEISRVLFRNSQLFVPDRDPQRDWDPASYGLDRTKVDEVWFESADGTPLHAWYCRAADPVASILYCHGNTGNLTFSAANIAKLNAVGLNVFVFDYRGFGRSEGRPTMLGVVADAAAAAATHDELRAPALRSILYGYSLGGAVSAQIARDYRFDGIVLQSTFTNLRDMARLRYPKLPLHMLSGSEFDTLEIVRHLPVPLLVIHGTADEVIPCWMGETLHRRCSSARSIYLVDGAKHTDLYERDHAGIIRAVHEFACSLQPPAAPPARTEKNGLVASYHRLLRKGRKLANSLAHPQPATG